MKKLFSLLFLIALASTSMAQSPIGKGGKQLNAGFGLSSWGLPVYLGLDFGVSSDITAGGEVSFRRYKENWQGNAYRHSITGISGNVNYHFNSILNLPSEWNLYAGLNLGFYVWSSSDGYSGGGSSGLGLGGQIGGRYYFNDKVGINLEAGGGNAFSGGKIGLSIKI